MARVLIVEDEAIIAADLRYRLESLTYEVVGVASAAAEALESTAHLQPDLVLMDIRLRGGDDGVAAAHEIRRRFALPVVYLTAYADAETLDRAKHTAPFGYVLKPVDDQKLHVALQIALHRHAMTRQLEESERWLSTTLDCLGDAVVATTDVGRVRLMNRVAQGLTGWPEADAVGQSVETIVRIVHAETRAPIPNPLLEAIERRSDVVLGADALLITRDGREVPIDDAAAPIVDERNRLLGAVLVFRDVTERKVLEAHLRQAQKMEAVGRLASGIAHDFNNLLTVILGRTELLRNTARSEEARQRDVELIHSTAQRANDLTRQLLAFGRKQMVVPEVVDVNIVLVDMQPMLRRLIGETVELTIRPAGAPAVVRIDPVQLQQVVLNLVVNARDAMPDGGRLEIETFDAAAPPAGHPSGDAAPGSWVALAVADTGIGMDAATQAHVFEPFFTTKGAGKGTGLGLASVHGIVDQNGGRIDVTSAPHRGSTFTVYLPRVDADPARRPSAPVIVNADARTGTVLLVEDEDDVRELIREVLELAGYRVLAATSGPEAVETCRRHQGEIDLLITDVVMPDMSGREVAERVRRERPRIGILYTSGYTDDVLTLQGLRKAEGLLPKPFDAETLLRRVQALLAG
jgi:PAS domain S-box-containing protein